jgi:hypothetical protein
MLCGDSAYWQPGAAGGFGRDGAYCGDTDSGEGVGDIYA